MCVCVYDQMMWRDRHKLYKVYLYYNYIIDISIYMTYKMK